MMEICYVDINCSSFTTNTAARSCELLVPDPCSLLFPNADDYLCPVKCAWIVWIALLMLLSWAYYDGRPRRERVAIRVLCSTATF